MSRQVKVLVIQPDPAGPSFGKILRPEDFELWQVYAHEHAEALARDFLVRGAAAPVVAGFGYALPGGLTIEIAAGQAVTIAGLSYDTLPPLAATQVVLDPADPALPRVDLIYALLATVDADIELTPHRQLRTPLQEEQGVKQYPSTNFNVANESHLRATVLVNMGCASANPVAQVVVDI